MPQLNKVTTPFYVESQPDNLYDDLLLQPDYFHGELNAGEDSLEWQEFARLQQPVIGG
jgi:hypothetical protein